jgi:hypothetical protein
MIDLEETLALCGVYGFKTTDKLEDVIKSGIGQ